MNDISAARTNYFEVRDPGAFRQKMEAGFGGLIRLTEQDGKFAVIATNGDWPDEILRDGNFEAVGFIYMVAEHLIDGEVAVFMQAGHEGNRYVFGYAVAITNALKPIEVNLANIYELAGKAFGKAPTRAEY